MNGQFTVIVQEHWQVVSVVTYPWPLRDQAGRDYLAAKGAGLDVHLFYQEENQEPSPAVELFPQTEVR